MKTRKLFYNSKILAVLCFCVLTGCSGGNPEEKPIKDEASFEETAESLTENLSENPPENLSENPSENPSADSGKQPALEPAIIEEDWSAYFNGINGAAVLYDPADGVYRIYNQELAQTRRSPCSTFKIISSLIALENGILDPAASVREWSGETFWNEQWNQNMDFEHAFRESCVWYFREVIDEIGQERMAEGLRGLSYGNCDISDWEGRLNTNNNNRALTGFWIESSLAISPKEQTEVMEHIFGENSLYTEKSREQLKQVMYRQEESGTELSIYGKTGMGKAEGVLVDAWYTGFAENDSRAVYFCVYLGRTEDEMVSSATAREIAVRLISDFYADEMK